MYEIDISKTNTVTHMVKTHKGKPLNHLNHARQTLKNILFYIMTLLLLMCFHSYQYTGIIPHNDEGGEWCFEHYEPHTTPGSFQGEVTIAWLVSLQSCQALDRPKVWTVHKQNF